MNLDNTYIIISGVTIFEPVCILTNFIFLVICIYCYSRLRSNRHPYAVQMSWFILSMGLGSIFGSIAHGVHYQLGEKFFNTIFFIMNGLSLVSIYYCFRAPYTYHTLKKETPGVYSWLVAGWVIVLLAISFVKGNFLIIKIHAGISLCYSLIVHYLAYRRGKDNGSRMIVAGIGVSFLSILVHSLKLSIHEWFNYKDLAHVIMTFSLIIIYRGIVSNLNSPSLYWQGNEALKL